jgi:predicted ArsR family transcriptional regulator
MDLATYKALGDDSRFALFQALQAAGTPCTASELATGLGLHPNTVRLHLERLREVGLVTVETEHLGAVGRPQHRYLAHPPAALDGARDSPESRDTPHALLAAVLVSLAEHEGAGPDEARAAGREWGRATEPDRYPAVSGAERLQSGLRGIGFSFAVAEEPDAVRITFADCPFRDLAEQHPVLVCNLHRGLCEGLVERSPGGRISEFVALTTNEPCRMALETAIP